MNKPIALNINFDSLTENLGFPQGYYDPSYFEIFDRFIDFANEYNFKYSIYIVGKDLENPEIKARVKDWSDAGHEIGNHSYSHRMNIGGLDREKIKEEILRSHELILSCTGIEPKGFICPGWSTSQILVEELINASYLYDCSLFPSYVIYPAVLKNALNHLSRPDKFREIIGRKDYLFPFTKPLKPFFADKNFKTTTIDNPNKIVILPLPTINRFTMAMWHTLLFIYGLKKGKRNIDNYLKNVEYFYYLMHPADLTDRLDLEVGRNYTIERINVPIETKKKLFREAFESIKLSGRPVVTMKELAINFIDSQSIKI